MLCVSDWSLQALKSHASAGITDLAWFFVSMQTGNFQGLINDARGMTQSGEWIAVMHCKGGFNRFIEGTANRVCSLLLEVQKQGQIRVVHMGQRCTSFMQLEAEGWNQVQQL
jgi:hypothetical protein